MENSSSKWPNLLGVRHPNVLGSVMPSLTPEQFARLFGPASAIFLNASAFGGLKRALKPTSFPASPRGLLKLSPEIYDLPKQFVFKVHASLTWITFVALHRIAPQR